MWSRLIGYGVSGYRADVSKCLGRTLWLVDELRSAGVPLLCNDFSFTVLFPQPSEQIVKTYQLACCKGEAHAIVMPSVSMALLERFVADYLGWWKTHVPPSGASLQLA